VGKDGEEMRTRKGWDGGSWAFVSTLLTGMCTCLYGYAGKMVDVCTLACGWVLVVLRLSLRVVKRREMHTHRLDSSRYACDRGVHGIVCVSMLGPYAPF